MEKNIKLLATARKDLVARKEELQEIQAVIAETQLGKDLARTQQAIKEIANIVSTLEDEIKAEAIDTFDGENKRPHPAVTIKEFTVIGYDDGDAIQYAVDKDLYPLLSLKKAAFNKIAKTGICDFVKIDKENRAQIASDLSEYLD